MAPVGGVAFWNLLGITECNEGPRSVVYLLGRKASRIIRVKRVTVIARPSGDNKTWGLGKFMFDDVDLDDA